MTAAPVISPDSSAAPEIATLGDLRASGHRYRTVKAEIRTNLLARLAAGQERFPGILGFDDTVLPQVERALLAGHDLVLLGERGQGKTRLIRTMGTLLDEWTPVVAGCEINDHPYAPSCGRCRALLAAHGDDLAVSWKHRSERYGEKLATPDTSVGDLIGDVDPIKVAEGRTLGDPETVHYGLVPRTNRGIFSVNELPDLAERIQVALLNVLEERDIQVRGYSLRLPLDLLLVASANPEDYTNRGRIISPLKDRFGAEVRTHYPLRLDDEVDLVRQEAMLSWGLGGHLGGGPAGHLGGGPAGHLSGGSADDSGPSAEPLSYPAPVLPDHLFEVIARFTRLTRDAPQVDSRSGVSARFAIACAETVAASAVRRAAMAGEEVAVARVADLPCVLETVRGKVEFEDSEEGRELDVLGHLLRRATADTFRARLAGLDLTGLQQRFAGGDTVESGDLIPGAELLRRIGPVPGLARILERLGIDTGQEAPGLAAAALEFALEGLYLNRRLSKEELPGRTVYGG